MPRHKTGQVSCTTTTARAGQGHLGQEHEQGRKRAEPRARADRGKSRGSSSSSSSNRRALTDSQGHVDVMAQVLLQLQLLAQGKVGGPADHGQPVALLQCVGTHYESTAGRGAESQGLISGDPAVILHLVDL